MLLAVDIGNTATKFGLFKGKELVSKFSITTSSTDIANAIGDRLSEPIESAMVCSVVPSVDGSMSSFLRNATNVEPTFVNNSFDFGLKINYEPLDSLGTDRLVIASAAVEKYGPPCIVCSLGTATTIDVVNAGREFIGGIIAPGIDAMAEALKLKTAKLPEVEPTKPGHLLGNSTVDSIRSGLYHGYVAMVEGLLTRIRTEAGVSRIIGTGGYAATLSSELSGIMTVDEDLMMVGLRLLSTTTGA
jgi:type III pantothenate kinase